MNGKILLFVVLFTIGACFVFVAYNPNIAQNYTSTFGEGEIFTPTDNRYDFGTFTLNSSTAKNFTARINSNGHVNLADDTGNISINFIELEEMIPTKRDSVNSFLNQELEKPSWTVDGVTVHQIDFISGDELYSAYMKNSSTNTIIYLSTPDEQETVDMMNSLNFKEE